MIREANINDLDYINQILEYFKQPPLKEINNKILLINNIGMIFYQYLYDAAELYYIYVEKDFRNQKYGGKLLDAMFSDCQSKNIKTIFLEVRKSNLKAIKFYEKYGFKVINSRNNYYHNLIEDALILEKKLGD